EAKGSSFLEEVGAPAAAAGFLDTARKACALAGIDTVSVRFTKDLRDGVLGVTAMDTRDVWLSTQAVMLGENEFTRTYMEEALHAMTGYADNTREMQDALFAIIVNLVNKL